MDAMRKEAMAAAERAVELGPERPEGYRARAFLRQTVGWNWIGARRDLEQAMALNRGDARTVQEMGGLLFSTEGPTAAMPLLLTAVSIDPLSGSANRYLCGAYEAAGSFDNALRACKRAVELSPDSVNSRAQFGEVLLLQGSPAKALEIFDRIPEEQYRLYGVALAQFSLGRIRESDEALAGLVARWSHGWAYQISEVYGWRGDKDRAFEWLERAFARRDGGLGNIKYDPFLRTIHGDPRFTELLKKLNLPVD